MIGLKDLLATGVFWVGSFVEYLSEVSLDLIGFLLGGEEGELKILNGFEGTSSLVSAF